MRETRLVNLRDELMTQGVADVRCLQTPLTDAAIDRVLQQRPPVVLADSTTRHDLARLARAGVRSKTPVLLAGSAALAEQLAKYLPANRRRPRSQPATATPPAADTQRRGNTLVFTGSSAGITQKQLTVLQQKAGAAQIDWSRQMFAEAMTALAQRRHLAIRIPTHVHSDATIARGLKTLAPLLRDACLGSLILIGGDTAAGWFVAVLKSNPW